MKVQRKGDNLPPGDQEDMAQPRKKDQAQVDKELEEWMDRALGVRKPDPEPHVHDV